VTENDQNAAPVPSCCTPAPENKGKGFLLGLLYGLVPHTFCILFIVLSVLGATAATSVVKRFLYIPYLFQVIVGLSFVFATVSAVLYLRRNGILSWRGARFRWRYLTLLYGTTIAINLLFFMVIFPLVANVDYRPVPVAAAAGGGAAQFAAVGSEVVTLEVNIPCPGHAPLIMDELKKLDGITEIKYQFPNAFRVQYDPSRLTVQGMLSLEVFREFPAKTRS
jgi:hypothetical protein